MVFWVRINNIKLVFKIVKDSYINILGLFTKKTQSKLLESNVVYIPITILRHATPHDLNVVKNMAVYNLIGSPRRHG